MVTATTGYSKFRGVSGAIYTPTYYIDDVAANKILWAQQGKAGSGSDNSLQFPERVQLIDMATKTGPTVIVGWYWQTRNTPIASSNQLLSTTIDSVTTRSINPVAFEANAIINAVEF
jgi:hypothetical protein